MPLLSPPGPEVAWSAFGIWRKRATVTRPSYTLRPSGTQNPRHAPSFAYSPAGCRTSSSVQSFHVNIRRTYVMWFALSVEIATLDASETAFPSPGVLLTTACGTEIHYTSHVGHSSMNVPSVWDSRYWGRRRCPNCGSPHTAAARPRNAIERVLRVICSPYRCGACTSRFFVW
jgi:hypothetical protein